MLAPEAALSHTDSLAGSDRVVDTVLKKFNAYRAYTMDEFFDIGYACTGGLFPAGNRIGFVTISGGVGILMSDHAVSLGLDVARLSVAAQAKIKDVIPFAGTRNPVDITGQAVNQPEIVEHCLNVMIEEGEYDVIIVYFAGMTSIEFLRRTGLIRIRERYPAAVIIISVTMDEEAWQVFDGLNYLVIPEPTRAVRAAAALIQFGQRYAKADQPAPSSLPIQSIFRPRCRTKSRQCTSLLGPVFPWLTNVWLRRQVRPGFGQPKSAFQSR